MCVGKVICKEEETVKTSIKHKLLYLRQLITLYSDFMFKIDWETLLVYAIYERNVIYIVNEVLLSN